MNFKEAIELVSFFTVKEGQIYFNAERVKPYITDIKADDDEKTVKDKITKKYFEAVEIVSMKIKDKEHIEIYLALSSFFQKRIDDIEDIMRQELKKLNRFFWFGSVLAIIYTIKLFMN